MLDLRQIESFYPEALRPFKRSLLREYLQYKILEVIFTSSFAADLAFMGGTAIRILHSGTRFSEDLDFDSRSLDKTGFEALSSAIERRLTLEGYEPEIKLTMKGAFRSSIRIPRLLQESGITGHRNERLTIQVDAEPQHFPYTPHGVILNKFDVFVRVHVVPPDILLAQKIVCVFTRKRPMGRDFYDVIFLMAKTGPNLGYIRAKLGFATWTRLREALLSRCRELDFRKLSRELAPFLMNPGDAERVLAFPEYIALLKFP
jgi:hypothetical protein